MRISDVARKLGISVSLIRKAERQGRIPRAPRLRVGKQAHGQRRYTDEDCEQLRHVFFGPDERSQGPATTEPTAESPPAATEELTLARRHTINGVVYGPGVVKVPVPLARELLVGDERATEVGA
jgi:MerR HTH family regulatory protein